MANVSLKIGSSMFFRKAIPKDSASSEDIYQKEQDISFTAVVAQHVIHILRRHFIKESAKVKKILLEH